LVDGGPPRFCPFRARRGMRVDGYWFS